jgi:hypothetical protein
MPATITDAAARRPARADVERIDLLRNVLVVFGDDLAGPELPGLTREELLAFLQHVYAVQQRLLASAPPPVRTGYLDHLKRILDT